MTPVPGGTDSPASCASAGQQHRPQRGLPEQAAPLVEAQQYLGCAVDAGHRVGVGEIRRHRHSRRVRVHPVDLHGGVARSQAAVGDESGQRAWTDRVAELGDPRKARRTLYRAVHQDRSRRPRRLGIQVVAHHDIRDSLPGKGICQPSRRPAGCEQALHRIQGPDGFRRGQRNGVAHTPRAVAEHLQRLVVAAAPYLGGERGARRHQDTSGVVVLVEPVGGVVPVLRDRVEPARGSEPPVHASEVAAVTATSTTMPTATRLSRSGWANASRHTARGALPGSGMRPSRCARPNVIGSRSSGSSLWMLRSGVPSASRNA